MSRGSRLKQYGLSSSSYAALLREQNGICPVCLRRLERRTHIDHCHKCEGVFAVVHPGCNNAQGICDDPPSLRRRAALIDRHEAKSCKNPNGPRIPRAYYLLKRKIEDRKEVLARLLELNASDQLLQGIERHIVSLEEELVRCVSKWAKL